MHDHTLSPSELLRVLREHRRRWLYPTIGCGVAALVYVVFDGGTWEASQALIIRNEAASSVESPGRFHLEDPMKTKQETVLEIVKSRKVLAKALTQVGPGPNDRAGAEWPDEKAVDLLQEAVKMVAPKGAEFGKTEIFYLKVKDKDRQRAIQLASAICEQSQDRFQQLLEDRARSTTDELVRTVALSEEALKAATEQLAEMERQIGGDLGELRMLHGSPSGESDLRKGVISIENDLRLARTELQVNEELYSTLQAAQENPGGLLAAPNELLDSQPALSRLKDGLVDVQLKTAELQGNMSAEHPKVRAAILAKEEIARHIHDELAISLRGVEVEMRLNKGKVLSLEQQLQAARDRLDRLASQRAPYGSLVSNVEHQVRQCEQARRNLAEAKASQLGALSSNLISLVDSPDTGSRPLGPGKRVIVMAGFGGGMLIGLAWLFLSAPSPPRSHDPQAPVAPHSYTTTYVAPLDAPRPMVAPQGAPPAYAMAAQQFVAEPAPVEAVAASQPIMTAAPVAPAVEAPGFASFASPGRFQPAPSAPAASADHALDTAKLLAEVQATMAAAPLDGRTKLNLTQALEKLTYSTLHTQQS